MTTCGTGAYRVFSAPPGIYREFSGILGVYRGFPGVPGNHRQIPRFPERPMNRVELRLDDQLYERLCKAKPRSLSVPAFCAFLIEGQVAGVDGVGKLPASRAGAGARELGNLAVMAVQAVDSTAVAGKAVQAVEASGEVEEGLVGDSLDPFLKKQDAINKAENDLTAVNCPVNGVPKARNGRLRKARAEGSPEFERFWRQYQAIKRRASNQSKPRALAVWDEVMASKTPDALCDALTRAIAQQARQEREGGFASPFPDCFRWLRDGYYEAFLDDSTPAVVIPKLPDFTPPPEFPDAPF